MPHQFELLPIELQASVVELRENGVPEDAIASLIARTLQALGVKSNRVQVEVWQMEERLGKQLEQIGNKLQADQRTQLGATNQMLADLNTAQQEAGQGIADIKKSWEQMDTWRGEVDTWRGLLDGRVEGMSGDLEAVKQEIEKRKPFFDDMLAELAQLKHENLHDQLSREDRLKLTADVKTIPALTNRITLLEAMLERVVRLVVKESAVEHQEASS